ncbi:MAG: hypothetical protein ABIH20_02645 [Candidatus Diapherotrites archaeon]
MKRGQGSVSYLLLIGGAVLVAVVVITLLISLGSDIGEGTEGAFYANPIIDKWTKWTVACADVSQGYEIELNVAEPEKLSGFRTEDWLGQSIVWCPAEDIDNAEKTAQKITVTGSAGLDICDQFVVNATGDSVTFKFDMVDSGWLLFYADEAGTVQESITGSEKTILANQATEFPDIESYLQGSLENIKICAVFTEDVN